MYAVRQYTVKFKVDGKAISTQKVMAGEDATPPADPVVDGKKFTGWSGTYTNIQKNTIINATFDKGSNGASNAGNKEQDSKESSSSGSGNQSAAEALNEANNSGGKFDSGERQEEAKHDPSMSTDNTERSVEEVENAGGIDKITRKSTTKEEEPKKSVKSNYTGKPTENKSTTEEKIQQSTKPKSNLKMIMIGGLLLVIGAGIIILVIIKK